MSTNVAIVLSAVTVSNKRVKQSVLFKANEVGRNELVCQGVVGPGKRSSLGNPLSSNKALEAWCWLLS